MTATKKIEGNVLTIKRNVVEYGRSDILQEGLILARQKFGEPLNLLDIYCDGNDLKFIFKSKK